MHRFRIVSLVLFLLAGLAATFAPATASASTEWCWGDPVVRIGNQVVSINVGVQGKGSHVKKQVQRAHVVITVPAGVSTALLKTTSKHFPEVTQFRQTNAAWQPGQPVPVTVVVTFDASADLPAAMQILSLHNNLTASGSTRGQMSASFSLPQHYGPVATLMPRR